MLFEPGFSPLAFQVGTCSYRGVFGPVLSEPGYSHLLLRVGRFS